MISNISKATEALAGLFGDDAEGQVLELSDRAGFEFRLIIKSRIRHIDLARNYKIPHQLIESVLESMAKTGFGKYLLREIDQNLRDATEQIPVLRKQLDEANKRIAELSRYEGFYTLTKEMRGDDAE